eukprot:scaffold309005_cov18-Prasinocladus_malaysianus.AAC.2
MARFVALTLCNHGWISCGLTRIHWAMLGGKWNADGITPWESDSQMFSPSRHTIFAQQKHSHVDQILPQLIVKKQ